MREGTSISECIAMRLVGAACEIILHRVARVAAASAVTLDATPAVASAGKGSQIRVRAPSSDDWRHGTASLTIGSMAEKKGGVWVLTE